MSYLSRFKYSGRCIICTLGLLIFVSTKVMGGTPSLKPLNGETFKENKSNREWLMQRSKRIKKPEDVERFLVTLNEGKYSDWRLPTKQELSELFTVFDLKKNGEVKIRLEGQYWLAGDRGEVYVGAWEIGDQCGPSRTFYKGKAGYIRAVRP